MADPEILEQQVPVAIVGLEAQTRGEIDIQIATAKRFPRSVAKVIEQAMGLVSLSEDVAEQCFYAVPRDGKTIEGPSARLAEIMASCWGHMRSEARVVEETDTHVVSRGTSWDLERNVAVAFEVRRRITTSSTKKDRDGKPIPAKKFGDDMITTTSNAANSIAYRNSVFRVIPKAFWAPVYEKARKVAIGEAETLVAKRTKMLGYFQRMGVTDARLFAAIHVHGVEDITLEQLATLKGLAQAIKEGDTSVDDAFPDLAKEPQRVQTPPATTAPPSAPVDTSPPVADAETPAPSPSPVVATNGAGEQQERGVRITNTVMGRDDVGAHYAITTDRGMFHTREEQHYTACAALEGMDHTATIGWRNGRKRDGGTARVITSVTIDEPLNDGQQGSLIEGGAA